MSDIILFFPAYETTDVRLLPMSVLSVAAPLVKQGYEVSIIDQRVDKNWKKTLLAELKTASLAFGVSALTGKQILNGLEASKFVKQNSNIPVVWGGVHASLLPEQTLKNEYIDFVVVGEGEKWFQPQQGFIDLNKLPDIPYYLINIENYIAKKSFASGKPGRDIALYTSRGCPHRCGFCYNKEFNQRRWRGRSAEKVVGDMEKLIKDYQITSFNIEDDEFFVDIKRAGDIGEMILKKNIKVELFTNCRVNYVANSMDDDYLQLLYRAGFRTLAFGVESGSERILELMHKDIAIEQVFETIRKLKKAGINSKYYFMAGFPGETVEDLYKTTDLIQQMKQLDPQIRIPAWRIFTPYPGTELYNESLKYGFIAPKSLEQWSDFSFETFKTPWLTFKQKRIIKNAAFLINYLEMGKTEGRGIFFKLAKIFSRIVNWRWKNHFFSFVPEKYVINFLLSFKRTLFLFKQK